MTLPQQIKSSVSEWSTNVKNACSSDINFVPIKHSNKSGDEALFNYSDVLIVPVSLKVGMTKCSLLLFAACQANFTAQWSASHGCDEHVGSFVSGKKEMERHLLPDTHCGTHACWHVAIQCTLGETAGHTQPDTDWLHWIIPIINHCVKEHILSLLHLIKNGVCCVCVCPSVKNKSLMHHTINQI